MAVFRAAAGLPLESIWKLTDEKMENAYSLDIVWGFLIGLIGAGVAALFASFHGQVMEFFKSRNLLNSERAVERAMLGAVVVVGLGIFIPHTMFWGEYEIQTST